jgi:hypothetical protein
MIDQTFQSADAVAGGEDVNLWVSAHDPEGAPVTFTWSATDGVLGTAVTTASSSEVDWSAPLVSGTFTVTATATDASGLETTQLFDVAVDYQPSCPAGMVTYWKFDYGTGSDALGDNDATIVGSTPTTGIVGDGVELDGVDDQILASKSPSEVGLYQGGAPDMTMVAWFRLQQHGWFDQSPLVAVGGPNAWPHPRYSLSVQYYNNPAPRLFFWTSPELAGTTDLEWDRWYQGAVVVRNTEPQQVQLFLDGELDSQLDQAPAFPITDDAIRVGYLDGSDFFRHQGGLDEIALFDRALTPEEIRQLYLRSVAGFQYCQ